jgi:hypothetical protein
MKIKKRLKYKSTLPKADFGMDPNALSNMNKQKQAAEETPAQGGGMGAAGAMNMATQGLNFVSAFTPQDNNDGIGMSHKASKITSGISTGLDTAASATSSIPIVGAAIGGVSALFKMIKGAVDHKRENDRSITSRLARKEYDPTQDNVGYSFGNSTTSVPTSQPMFGGQAKYGMSLFKDGGKVEPIYTDNPKDKRLQAYNDSLKVYNKLNPLFNKQFPNGSPLYAKNYSGVTNEEKEEIDKATTLFDLYDSVMNRSDWKSKVGITKSGYGTYYPNKPKKPIQPVIYKKNDVRVPVPKVDYLKNLPNEEEGNVKIDLNSNLPIPQAPNEDEQSTKGKPLPDFLIQNIKTPNGMKTYKRKDTNSGWQEQYALGGMLNKRRSMNSFNDMMDNSFYSPDGQFFTSQEQYQRNQDLYYPQQNISNLNPIINNYGRMKFKHNNLQFALGGDPRSQSNIEAEKDEAMRHTSDKVENIGGKTHPNGGTPIEVQPEHKYIYSDSIGTDKNGNITLNEKDVVKSFADDAKGIQRKYSKREGDPIVDATKKFELDSLQQKAEQARVAKEQIEMGKQMKKYKAKYGANLKRFDNSGNPQQPSSIQPSSIMTPEEMKALYEQLNLQAKGVSSGLNNTIGEMKQTSQQLDANTQRLQQMSNPQINAPLYNLSSKYDGDSQTEPITLKTPWGTYDRSGNLKNNINPITPIGPKKLNIENTQVGITNTPQPLFGGGNRINPFVGPRVPSRRATPSIDQRSTAPEVADKVKNGMFSSLTTGDKMQLASMLPAFGFNMGMGLRKADVEPNRKNPYENDVLSMMANRKFDIQNYLNQSNLATNTAKEDIGNNSTSVGGKMANLQKLFANQSNALGDITTKGQEMNNQYRAEEANTKNIIGEANRAESIRAAGINDQNKARKQQFLAKAFEQMGQGIATTGQSANQSLTNKLLIKSLSEISPDFDVKNMKDLQVGDDGYIVFKGVKTEFKMSNEGKIVMAGGTPNTANAAKSQYAPKDFTMKAFANFTKTKTKG